MMFMVETGSRLTRVFVYESLSAGGLPAGMDAAVAAELRDQGQAMRDALAADLAALPDVLVSCASAPDALASLPVGVCAVTPVEGEYACDFVARESRGHDAVWVIAPETGGELAGLCEAVPTDRWIGCTTSAIRIATSKTATRMRLAAAGIAVPLALPPHEGAWVVKPDDGAGACATQVHPDYASAEAAARTRRAAGEDVALEAWVTGDAMSLALNVVGKNVRVLAINRQHISVTDDGVVALEGVDTAVEPTDGARGAEFAKLARALTAAIPGLAGYVGVDLVWHPQRGPVVIEINPRVTLAYVGLSAALGRNVAGEVLAGFPQQIEVGA